MFTNLTLKNFQKHKKLSLDLEQITTIIGPSDAGKSAILRAFRWVCLSRPSGSEFIRKGSRLCRVTLDEDEMRIIRTKSDGENTYTVQEKEPATPTGSTGSYKALKGTVPEEVAKILNVDEVNFQKQLDGPFWLNLTPGEVGKELNSLMNLDRMDSLLSHIASQLRSHQTKETLLIEQEDQTIKKLKTLDWLEEAEKIDAEIELLSGRMRLTYDLTDRLESLLDKVERLEASIPSALPQEQIDEIVKLDVQVKKLATLSLGVSKLCCKLDELVEERDRCTKEANRLKRQIEERMKDGCPVCGNPTPSLSLSPIST